jgi:glycogen(starch) synthase
VKIAMLSDCYLPRLGGIEVQVHDLASRLMGRGHEVVVFTATSGGHGERGGFVDRVDGVEVHRLALRLPFELPVNPLAPGVLRQRLASGGFDVVHVHMGVVSPFAVDGTRVATEMGLPTAMTWHCMLGPLEPVFRAAGHVRRWASRGVVMSAVSGVAAEPLQRLVGNGSVVNVLSNGIDVDRWATPAELAPRVPGGERGEGGPDTDVRVVSAMGLASRKRPLPLLRTMARVRASRAAIPNDSRGAGATKMSAAAYVCWSSSRVTLPARLTQAPIS